MFFIIICVVTRGLRFFLVAFLTYKYGVKFGPFLEKSGAKWSLIISGIIIIIGTLFYFLMKWKLKLIQFLFLFYWHYLAL